MSARQVPTSYGQRRLWFIDRLQRGTEYNLYQKLRLRGALDTEALTLALKTIVQRHESLRTRFEEIDGEPVQVIESAAGIEVPFEDFSSLTAAERHKEMQAAAHVATTTPFDLEKAPLLRAKLFKLGAEDHILSLTVHHIIWDAWSEGLFMGELKALYEAFQGGRKNPLKPLAFQYGDFASWERRLVEEGWLNAGLQYWMDQLGGIPEYLELPTDRPRPAVQTFESDVHKITLNPELVVRLHQQSENNKASLYMTLLAAFGMVLSRYSGQNDIVIGSPVANRPEIQLEEVIGFFLNTVAMRVRLNPELSFRELLAQVRQTALGAYEHADVPFDRIVENLSPTRSLNRTPVFQVMFTFVNSPPVRASLNGLAMEQEQGGTNEFPARFDLEMQALEHDGKLHINWLYNSDLFDGRSIEQMSRHFVRLLNAVVVNIDLAIGQITMLEPHEQRQVLYEWNATEVEYPRERCVQELIEAQVEKTPEAVAVVFEDAVLSYGELNRRANQLSHYLRELGVGPDTRVALCVERGLEMLVGLLGILKAGGAYVPLDPAYPQERLQYMLADSAPVVLLTQARLQGLFAAVNPVLPVLELDADAPPWHEQAQTNPLPGAVGLTSQHLAYVIYTSGSTGTPKGVMISHAALINFLRDMQRRPGIAPEDIFLGTTTLSFDIAALELYLPLMVGAQLRLLRREAVLDGEALAQQLAQGATLMQATPTSWQMLVESGWEASAGLKALCGGEALGTELARQLVERSGTAWNMYGPTETTVWSLVEELEPTAGRVSLGRPIANTQVYILDGERETVPVGVAGELYIGGDGVGRGYWQRADLTAERFVSDPFAKEHGARMYRTGDQARWLADGRVEFLGRIDQQVKVRGYRIELGEIEARLVEHEAVREAIVIAREEAAGDKRLVAYYTSVVSNGNGSSEGAGAEELRRHLSARLPEYMVPAVYVHLEQLPLTPNGKLDRKALPAPAGEAYAVRGYEEPVGEIEKVIASIWAELLKLERVGRYDNFFDLGGHSLLAMRMISQMRKTLAVEVAVRDLFTQPVLTDFVRLIESAAQVTLPPLTRCERGGLLPLSLAQQRLWLLAQMGASQAYHIFYGWRMKGQLDRGALREALDRIIARHETLRTTFESVEGEPHQRIAAAVDSSFHMLEHDLSEQIDSQEQLDQLVREEAAGAFDLAAGPLIRGRLVALGGDEHALLITMHHIVSDGWSMDVFVKELSALYGAFVHGDGDPLPELEVQYADYAVWQRRWMEGEVLRQQAEYWQQQLAGAPAQLELPIDHARRTEEYVGRWMMLELDEELTQGLKELSKQHGVTLYMTLVGAWATLLARLSGQGEVVIGTPVANRGQIETEGLIGFFINILALRLEVAGSVDELLRHVKEQVLAAQQHQDIPFEQVVEAVQPVRSLMHSPLFQVGFDWQHGHEAPLGLPGLEVRAITSVAREVAKFDLRLWLRDGGERIVGGMEYATALFDESTVERYLGYLRLLLQSMVRDSKQPVESLPLLSAAEQHEVISEWNATEADYPRDRCVHELFEQQVEKSPAAAAVVFEDQVLSYGELNRRANQLAHYLRALGVGSDRRVAICAERGLEMIIALLGVLKAGGAYVPLDPAYPEERLQYMLVDSAPAVLLTEAHLQGLFAAVTPALPVLELDAAAAPWSNHPEANPLPDSVGLNAQHPAYVIYTSGSTGRAKGVVVEHRQLLNYVAAISDKLQLKPGWACGLVSTFAADLGNTVLFPSLLGGGCLHLISAARTTDADAFNDYCRERGIDCLKITPSHLQALLGTEERSESIPSRCLVLGGEALSPELMTKVQALRPGCHVYNHYGPTECTVGALSQELKQGEELKDRSRVGLGQPLGNMRVYVLDEEAEAVPVGVVGELYIGGAGVARGYWGQTGATAEKFLADPYSGTAGARMYRTGDLGRRSADGTIQFLGRNDFQVKVRGYRIELGEIESRLVEHEAVREAVVTAREEGAGDKRLVAYYTSVVSNGNGSSEGAGAEELRQHLLARLPEYMVPAAYVHLEQLPLTPNGKLDRRALPAPDGEAYAVHGYVEPVGKIEPALAEIWAEVLKLERVGRYDNFFELGGHSLLAVGVLMRLQQVLNVEVTIGDLFERPVLAELAAVIESAAQVTLPPITRCDRTGLLPLSFAQQRLWLLAQMGASQAYHIFYGWRLKGQLDCTALRQALDRIVARHETLRTTFESVEGEPHQRIAAAVDSSFHLLEHDFSVATDSRKELDQLITAEAAGDFDLAAGPLIRGRLIRLGEDEHALLITLHHIVSDGWSRGILMKELSALYGAFTRNEGDPLPEMQVQYADYAVWQRRWIEGEVLRQQSEYWQQQLAGAPALLELPVDHARPVEQEYVGRFMELELDEELTRGLKELSRQHGVTLYMTLMAAWATLLGRLSGQAEVVIGTPVVNRSRAEVEGLIGFFINMLSLRLEVAGSVGELLRQVKEQVLAAQQNQDIPFEQVVEVARPVRTLSHSPIFQVVFEWHQDIGGGEPVLPGLELTRLGTTEHVVSKFDLTLYLGDTGDRLLGGIEYATALFEDSTVERYIEYLRTLLQSTVAEGMQSVERLAILPESERRQVLYEWNATETEYPRERCAHELIEEQVEKTPEATAVMFEDEALSYAELNRRVNQLAHYLRGLGVGPDVRVGICAERGLEMIIGLLGVLKAGGAYVPLDPAYPQERLQYMLADSAPAVLLTQSHLQGLFAAVTPTLPVLELDGAAAPWSNHPETNLSVTGVTSQHLAYVIYTSGSTGTPKGAMVEQRGMLNHLFAKINELQLSERDVVAQTASVCFDISVWQFLAALVVGGRVLIVGQQEAHDPQALPLRLEHGGVTVWETVPSLLEAIVDESGEGLSSLRWVVVTGEACPVGLCRRWLSLHPRIPLLNAYGPTECSDDVTHYVIDEGWSADGATQVPIGRALMNLQVYVLGREREAVPVGVVGELYIGGDGVGRGYWERAEQTAEWFVSNPFAKDHGARMYRTGDLGRCLADGTIEFVGRIDHQVKVRGYRIELGEIETRLVQHEAVREAVVLAREEGAGDKRLVAYYTSVATNGNGSGEGAGAEELRRHLSALLPEYMVPAAYVHLEQLPLTPNGKLDRKALPAPDGEAYAVRGYEEPVGEIETAIAEIWTEVLKLEQVGRYDNFFELGGNSLLAMRVIALMRQAELEIHVRTLFATPMLAELAAEISLQDEAIDIEVPPNLIPIGCKAITPEMLTLVQLTPEEIQRIVEMVLGGAANIQDVYPLAPLQEGIFFHHLMGGDSDPYLAAQLFAFDTRKRLNSYLEAMQAVVDRHDILRTGVMWEGLPEPLQVVWRKARLVIEEVTLEAGDGDAAKQLYARYNPRSYRMDVRQAPLLRLMIAHDEEQGRWLMLQLRHHLASDHTTLEVMQQEIEAYLLGEADSLPSPLPFRELVAQARLGVSQEEHEEFFRRLLGDVEEPTTPFGLLNIQGDGRGIEQAYMQVEERLGRRIRESARRLKVSAASLCHVAWAQVVARAAGVDDVVFGTLLFGRMKAGEGSDRVMGVFTNTLPVRIRVGEETVESAVRWTHRMLTELMKHEHASLALAQRCSAVPAPAPLFSSLLNYRHSGGAAQPAEKAQAWEGIQALSLDTRTNYPATLSVDDFGDRFRLMGHVEASIGAIRVCRYMHRAMESLVEALDHEPGRALQTLEVMPESERQQVLYKWNATEAEYPRERCVHELLEQQVEKTPEAVAVQFQDELLSYGELNRRANQLAHYLRSLGVGPDVRVGICMERSLEMMVGLLGVLKAGGAYIPLDPAYPQERLQYMLADSAPVVLLTQAPLQQLCSEISRRLPVLELDGTTPPWSNQPETNPLPGSVGLSAQHLAYVIYTSGSTGTPKGVLIEHEGLCNYLQWASSVYSPDRAVVSSSFSFDATITSIYTALLRGGTIRLLPEGQEIDDLYKQLQTGEKCGLIKATPGLLSVLGNRLLSEGAKSGVSVFVIGGEALPQSTVELWRRIQPDVRLVNEYGPTETVVGCVVYELPKEIKPAITVPIGSPIANTNLYILNSDGEPVPVGVTGELFIGGAGVARGYLNRAELTADRFVGDPFAGDGSRMYKTGDLGRWSFDGTIEFLGRNDSQVKIRGYRIELEEIETVLNAHPGVKQSAVMMRDESGQQNLVAYVVSRDPEGPLSETYVLPNGMTVAHQNRNETAFLYEEIFERQEYFQHGIELSEGSCVFDVGANIGLFTLLVGENFPDAKIYAFEPIDDILRCLTQNAARYEERVTVFPYGLSDREQEVNFNYYPCYSMMSRQEGYSSESADKQLVKRYLENEQERGINGSDDLLRFADELLETRFHGQSRVCRLRRLSDVIKEQGIERINLLKIDVERSEEEVLGGIDEDDWEKIDQIVMEAHDDDREGRRGRVQVVVENLERRGFVVVKKEDEYLRGTGLYNLYARRAELVSNEQTERVLSKTETSVGVAPLVTEGLREYLQRRLPEYMVPAAYVHLEQLPLTANGKLDRKALPAPDGVAYGVRGYEEPLGEIEIALANIWMEVLGVQQVGRHDNFFDLGGHSLLAVGVLMRLQQILNVEVTIGDLFERPVLADLASAIESAAQVTLPPITRCDRSGPLPLSFAQQRLWLLAQMGVSEPYHVFSSLQMRGQLNRAALRRSLDRIVARHEALRTTFVAVEGEPHQRITPAVDSCFPLLEHDLTDATDSGAELDQLVREEAAGAFDLAAGPLIRGRLIRQGGDEHALLITMHHIVSDGWSMDVFVKELSTLYGAFVRGDGDPLPELEVQYADYAVWQRRWMEGEVLRQQSEYWQQQLAGAPALLELPIDHVRPAEQEYVGGRVKILFDEELTRGLKELSKQHGVTLYMTLLGAWATLLARLSGQADVVIGTPVANRSRAEVERLIGFFINTLPLRLEISGNVGELLRQVKEQVLAAQQHQDIPFEQIVEVVQPVRNLAYTPLFQVLFAWHQHIGGSGLMLPGLELAPLSTIAPVITKFDLRLSLRDSGERIVGGMEYATALFDEATVEGYLGYLRLLLQSMVRDSNQAVASLPLLSTAAQRQVVTEWNATEVDYARDRCVHEWFEAQVEKTPEAAAVVFEDEVLSYGELNRRANQLAHYLSGLGVGPEQRVAICAERGSEMIIGLLGVLKAGGAYVPLDPAYPQERLQYMLADSGPAVLLTEAHLQRLFATVSPTLPVLELDGAAAPWRNYSETNLLSGRVGLNAQHPAYVIYTSGSTGRAKGVVVEHRQLLNYVAAISEKLALQPGWACGLVSTFAADLGHTVLFPSLLGGGCLHLISAAATTDADRFHAYCRERGIDCLKITPSHLQALLGTEGRSEALPGRCLVLGGEALSPELVAKVQALRPGCQVYNHYGPTECTVGALSQAVRGEELKERSSVGLGQPLGNMRVYVLDEEAEPVPVGVVGELYIGGAGVARGYWGEAGATAAKFVADPYSGVAGGRMYRTGDLGRRAADGTIQFLGRNDFQVKVRGYRIELGEIEARLVQHEAVREAVVMARAETGGDKRLVAYYTSVVSNGNGSSEGAGAEELRRHLSALLPEYMVPAAYVHLEQLPLTPNGKLDRKALPAPDGEAYAVRVYAEPVGKIETALANIWMEVLKLERVGRYDNFFELGGNSLLVVRVIARMRRAGWYMDVHMVFTTPVLAELAAGINQPTDIVEVPPNRIPEIEIGEESSDTIEISL